MAVGSVGCRQIVKVAKPDLIHRQPLSQLLNTLLED